MGFFSPKDGAAKIEADLHALEKRRGVLQSRLGDQVSAAQRAAKVALDYLVTGDDDQAKQRELEEAAREARRAADSIAAALTEIDARIEDATRSLTNARDSEVRERRAAEMESAATAIVKRAKELEKAADALANAFTAFVQEVPLDALALKRFDSNFTVEKPLASPADIARTIVAQSLYVVSPELFEIVELPRGSAPAHIAKALVLRQFDGRGIDWRLWGLHGEEASAFQPATLAAEKMLVEPLRRMAQALRENSE